MKKTKLIIALAIVAASYGCSSQEPTTPPQATEEPQTTFSSRTNRSVDEAADVALQSLSMLPQTDSRAAARTFDKHNVKVATTASESRSGKTDTLMYVFNFDNEQGFAAIAADSRVKPLIAITEQGSYDPNITPDNPGLAMYMDAAETLLESVADGSNNGGNGSGDNGEWILKPGDPYIPGTGGTGGGQTPNYPTKEECDTTWAQWIHPNYDIRWGQRYPEGMLCSNGVAGCSNIGCLIAMSYLEMPNQLSLTYEGSNNETINIDWTAIKNHKQSYYLESQLNADGCNPDVHTMIAKTCRELGERNNTVYRPDGSSGTLFDNLPLTLRGMGMNVTDPEEWKTFDPYLSIVYKNVVITRGQSTTTRNGITRTSGHVWVIDGFNYWNVTKKTFVKVEGEWNLRDSKVIEFRYNHINWGWNGTGNGYFAAFTWNPGNPYFYDKNCGPASSSEYNTIRYIIVSKQ